MFGTTQFLRNWFMENELVLNIPIYISVYRNWIYGFLKTTLLPNNT
jgi:hypothetical protein